MNRRAVFRLWWVAEVLGIVLVAFGLGMHEQRLRTWILVAGGALRLGAYVLGVLQAASRARDGDAGMAFRSTLDKTVSDLKRTMDLWRIPKGTWGYGVEAVRPRSPHGSAWVSFTNGGREYRVTCDRYVEARDNLRACWMHIEAARLDDKRGTRTWQEALKPYLLLGAGPQRAAPPLPPAADNGSAWSVLGLLPGQPISVVVAAYKERAKALHPDRGGDGAAMARLNAAYETIKTELGGRSD